MGERHFASSPPTLFCPPYRSPPRRGVRRVGDCVIAASRDGACTTGEEGFAQRQFPRRLPK